MRTYLIAIIIGTLLTTSTNLKAQKRYDNYKVVLIDVQSTKQIKTLHHADAIPLADGIGLGKGYYVLAPLALNQLSLQNMAYDVVDHNLQLSIDAEQRRLGAAMPVDPRAPISTLIKKQIEPGWYDEYKTFDQIMARISSLGEDNPDFVEVTTIAHTFENREVKLVHLGKTDLPKPAIMIVGGIHGREWISPMVTMYLLDTFIASRSTPGELQLLFEKYEVVIVPMANPDGYVYAHTNDRLWRKNRRALPLSETSGCYGVDLNRNWDAGWGTTGASDDPCEINYAGQSAFSEPETAGLSEFIKTHGNIKRFIDMHAFSQLILWPYGFDHDLEPPDEQIFAHFADNMGNLIKQVHEKEYKFTIGYEASGTSKDWVYDDQNIIGYTFELRPTMDEGYQGFEIAPSEIVPNGEELLPAVTYLAQTMKYFDGQTCDKDERCNSGYCSDGVCCNEFCGGSNPTDCQVCSQSHGASQNGFCTFLPTTTLCRKAADLCDADEYCTGFAAECPPDLLLTASDACRPAYGACDAVEYCTGEDIYCPENNVLPDTTICRKMKGKCDLAEFCTGHDAGCPEDNFEPKTTQCREAAGDCDLTEYCTGQDAGCPSDEFESNEVTCRASQGDCDTPENCTGYNAHCPADALQPHETVCRATVGACDPTEFCDGDTKDCPPNEIFEEGQWCDDLNPLTQNDKCTLGGICLGEIVETGDTDSEDSDNEDTGSDADSDADGDGDSDADGDGDSDADGDIDTENANDTTEGNDAGADVNNSTCSCQAVGSRPTIQKWDWFF